MTRRHVVGIATIVVGVAGVALAITRVVTSGTPKDGYERMIRITWVVWLGLALLAISVGTRWWRARVEAHKLASLYAIASLLAAVAWAVVVGAAFSSRFAAIETAWCIAGGAVWPATLLAMAMRGSRV